MMTAEHPTAERCEMTGPIIISAIKLNTIIEKKWQMSGLGPLTFRNTSSLTKKHRYAAR